MQEICMLKRFTFADMEWPPGRRDQQNHWRHFVVSSRHTCSGSLLL